MSITARRLLTVTTLTLATATGLVSAGSTGSADAAVPAGGSIPPLPPPDPAALRASISGLPDDDVTSAQVDVTGRAGYWSGRSGVADVRFGRSVAPHSRFRIASATKMFTATIVLQLAAERRLRLGDTVQQWLPGLLPTRFPAVTVGQLLDHTSGLPMSQEDAGHEDPAWVVQHRLDRHTPEQIIATAAGLPMAFAPGSHQQYNGVNYFLAGMVIEQVTGRSYAYELQRRLIHPLHLHDTYLPRPSETRIHGRHVHGYVRVDGRLIDVAEQSASGWAESGMISTTADLGRLLRALLAGRLLPRGEMRELLRVPDVDYFGTNSGCAQGPGAGHACFSMGLQRTEFPGGLVLWGKSGGLPGYSTLVVGTADLRRTLSLSLTTTGNRDGSESDHLLGIAGAAFGVDV